MLQEAIGKGVDVETARWQARVDLAAAHRLCVMNDFHEGIFNHLTYRVPGTNDRYYQIPFGLYWSEVTASCFMEVSYDGERLSGEGVSSPAMILSRVVLPEPLGPRSATSSPSLIDRLTSRRATYVPNALPICESSMLIGVFPLPVRAQGLARTRDERAIRRPTWRPV